MVQLIFEITWSCPCKCSHCPVPKTDSLLPLSSYERIMTLFKTYYKDDKYAVVLSGGEPTTVSFLKDYVDAARKHGYMVTIVTNGFNPRNILNSKPDLVEVSIDYFGKRHDWARGVSGLFDNAMMLVEDATHNNIPVVVRSTAMKDNIQDILLLRRHLDDKGLKDVPILVMPVRGVSKLKPSQTQLHELGRHNGIHLSDNCPAGISSFVITPHNEVLPCIFYRKKLGQFWRFTKEELDEVIKEGAKIPRFPCERQ